MFSARQVGRWALFALAGVAVIALVFRVGMGVYLATDAGRAMVARQIASRIGMPVEVRAVRLGFFTSNISMRVFDPKAADPGRAEVLAVESARADVSVFDLARGRVAPTRVDLDGVNLTLHVSADGAVLTGLPTTPEGAGEGAAFPAVHLNGGRLTVRQDGRPEFSFRGLDVTARPEGSSVTVSGTIDDPEWSKWRVGGEVNCAAKTGWVELATDDGPLTMDRLGSIPFVPPAVWKRVRPDGRGGVALKLAVGSDQEVRYRVDIRPRAADITLPDAEVTLAKVTGLIWVAGAKVGLSGTRAELAGGTLAADGEFDFGPEPTAGRIKVAADRLDIAQLPESWGLPRDIEGKLKGHADLSMLIDSDGRVEPRGGGDGTIEDARIRGIPVSVAIRLGSDGKRYRFESPRAKADAGEKGPGRRTEGVRPAIPPELLVLLTYQDKKPADPKPSPKQDDAPTTLDASVKLRDIEIAELLEKTNVKLGYKISGKVTAEVALSVPLGRVASQAAYEFSGTVTSPAVRFEGLTVRDLSAKVTYKDGRLRLTELTGKVDQPGKPGAPPGVFRGTATAARNPPGEVTADLTFDRVPPGEVLKAIPGFAAAVTGTASGKAEFRTNWERLEDPAAWTASGELTAPELVVEGRTVKGVRLTAAVAKGEATLTEARATVEGVAVTGDATLALSGNYPFKATVRANSADVADLRKLIPEIELGGPVEGVLNAEAKVTGTAEPFTFAASGSVTATKLTLGRSAANHVALKWEVTPERVAVTELKADVFGGTVTGSADVPLLPDKAGKFGVTFKNVDAAPASELVPDFPVRIAGKVSGTVAGTVPPTRPGQSRVGNLDVDLTAPKLTVQGVPAERLAGKATVRGGAVDYSLEGKTLGGSFEVKGRYPGKKKGDMGPVPMAERGTFRLTGLDLSRVATDVGIRSLRPLRGRVDASFEFENDLSAGLGRVVITGLQWGDAVITREVVAALVLRDGRLELTDVAGTLAGGSLRARAFVHIPEPKRNFFTLTVDGADAARLFAPVADLGGVVDGRVTVVVRGRLGPEVRGSGTLSMPRGSVGGVAVTDLRVPFEWATAPGGYGQFSVREAAARAGSGRVLGEVTVDWGFETRVAGQLRFTDVPVRAVAPSLGENSLVGNGRITGRFDVGGRNVRSADDLTGTLLATLNQTSVREVPLLRQAVPFLNSAPMLQPLDAGDLRATLSRGVFRVERLALASPQAQLFAEGTVTTSGRVDLGVVAHTGAIGPDVRGLRLLARRVPAAGLLPLTLIQDVTAFLSNRTVRLSITGTVDNPIVRVNVGALLTEQAVRFFLSRYVVPAEAAAALGLGSGFSSKERK